MPMQTELILPNDPCYLSMARNYVQELCALAGLGSEETQALVLAADEACTNTIEHAFEPEEIGAYAIKSELTPLALTLAVHDRGLPFDASLAPVYRPPEDTGLEGASTRGLGLYLIRRAADEVQWINHGREGKELRLTKYRPHSDVTEHLPSHELDPYRDDEPQAPPQEYTIRWMRPDETIWVSQCIYRTYGRTHPNEFLYQPDRMAHMLEAGEIITAAAVDEAGDLAGFSIARPGAGRVGELHEVAVVPKHRGRGLMKRMTVLLDDEMRREGTRGVFSEAVTNHLFTQKVLSGMGFRDCGLTLGSAPVSQHFKGIEAGPVAQRGSWTLAFKHLSPPVVGPRHVPGHHAAMVRRIYEHLDMPVAWDAPGGPQSDVSSGPGKVVVSYYSSWGFGEIIVEQPGSESLAEIHRALRDLCDLAGAEAVYLELPLAHSAIPALCSGAESAGFFLAGLGPHFAADGDMLRLQFLNTALDTRQIQLLDPFAQEMLAYMESERARVGQHEIH
jgi:anti-sigma regulatory factor (Ser/Thr protein kinase)/GNAT superfamily N-acetyltransferase